MSYIINTYGDISPRASMGATAAMLARMESSITELHSGAGSGLGWECSKCRGTNACNDIRCTWCRSYRTEQAKPDVLKARIALEAQREQARVSFEMQNRAMMLNTAWADRLEFKPTVADCEINVWSVETKSFSWISDVLPLVILLLLVITGAYCFFRVFC